MSIILKLKSDGQKRILRGHDHYWKVMRELTEVDRRKAFTARDVDGKCRDNILRDVKLFLKLLVDAGIAKRIYPDSVGEPKHYRLNARPIETPVLSRSGKTTSGQAQQNMWNTMCYGLKAGFKIRDLLIMASTDEVPLTSQTVSSYVKTLNKAGMFAVKGKGVATTYRLKPSCNTGPKAPKILRSKLVYDANTETIVGDVIAEEVSS